MKALLRLELEVNNDSQPYINDLCEYVENTIENQLETDESAGLIKDDWNYNINILDEKSKLEEENSMNIDIVYSCEETINQLDIQIKQRAKMCGLTVGEYLKRLAINDIRNIDNLEVEEKYRLK